ncbi:MAG: VOC family protein [Hyphomonadaceae bacterium]|nr:VOC family protein [Hyphomonadaceae bacterium]
MPIAELGRVALVVDDMSAVAKSLKEIFEIDLRVVNAEQLGIKAAIGNQGVELVEKVEQEPRLAKHWRGPVAAICIRVDDAKEINRRMEAAGFSYVQSVKTASGLSEFYYGANFYGLPLVIYESSGDFDHEVGAEGNLELEWRD